MELYSIVAVAAFLLSWGFARAIRPWALHWGYVDHPLRAPERTIHRRQVPYGGGIAIAASVVVVLSGVTLLRMWPMPESIQPAHLVGMLIGAMVLLSGGAIDDSYSLSPKAQLVWSMVAIAVVLASGILVERARLPWGGVVSFGSWSVVVTVGWLLLVMYSTKLFDGLDGLVTGIGAIGGLILFAVSLLPVLNQPQNALVAFVFASACLGFLIHNWHPARMFLGQGGSIFIGYMLGVLSVMTGTKVITTLLVIGIPLMDAIWVVVRRMLIERRSPFRADRKHFHHRLLDVGLTHRQAVSVVLMVTALFGVLGYLLQTQQKVYALIALALMMLALAAVLLTQEKRNDIS